MRLRHMMFALTVLLFWSTLAGAQVGPGRVLLRWNQRPSPQAPIVGYAVWKASEVNPTAWVRLTFLPPRRRGLVDTGALPGETWYYAVQALSADGGMSPLAVFRMVIPGNGESVEGETE